MNRFIKSIIVVAALLLSGCYVYPSGVRYGIDIRSHVHDRNYYNKGYYYRNRPGYRHFYPGQHGGIRDFQHNRNFGQRYQGGFHRGHHH